MGGGGGGEVIGGGGGGVGPGYPGDSVGYQDYPSGLQSATLTHYMVCGANSLLHIGKEIWQCPVFS